MRFLRHLSAVVLTVVIIVGMGMLWAHASGDGTGTGASLTRAPSPAVLRRLEQVKGGAIRALEVRPDDGFHLANTSNLIQTCEIEAALAAVVITVSAVRRRHRRRRRTAART